METKSTPFYTLEMQALAECLTVCMKYTICPTCKAQGENPCTSKSGKKVPIHSSRSKQAHKILATPFQEAVDKDIDALFDSLNQNSIRK